MANEENTRGYVYGADDDLHREMRAQEEGLALTCGRQRRDDVDEVAKLFFRAFRDAVRPIRAAEGQDQGGHVVGQAAVVDPTFEQGLPHEHIEDERRCDFHIA